MTSAKPTPRALADARSLLSHAALAVSVPASQRRLAWLIAASARGRTIRQSHRPANTSGGLR